jgi:predicted permease
VLAARIRALFLRKRLERELDAEIRFHLEMQAEDNIRAGMDSRQATDAASRSFGGVMRMKETYRERRAFHPFETIAQDVRYALRMMRKNPGFTIVAILSLAIGIGANTAVFSIADALLLRPLPVPRPGEVITVGSTASIEGFSSVVASYRDYVDIRDRSESFEGLAAFTESIVGLATERDGLPRLRIGMLVSGNFFSVMRVEPQLGRTFRSDEVQVPGRDAVVILGHDFWEQQFGGDRSVLGRKVLLNGIEFIVVGVAPDSFTGLSQLRSDFYAPLMMWPRLTPDPNARPLEARDARSLTIKGRLKPGVTMTEAETELSVIAKDLERAHPDTNRNRTMAVRTELQTRIAADPTRVAFLAMLTTLAGAVLFVACANVAGLLTSRAPVRAREVAMRLAIGAGRLRLIRQLITESVLLAMLGAVFGLGIGDAGVMLFRQVPIPTELPIAFRIELDRRALVFSLLVALASAVLFGLAPAIRSTRADLTSVMKATDAAGFGRHKRWGRALLVCGQVAVSVVLLVVALFMYRGFQRMLGIGPAYRIDHLLMMSLSPGLLRYTASQSERFVEQVAERARSMPGVKSVALASSVPMTIEPAGGSAILPEGFQFPSGQESGTVLGSSVDEHYFETMGIAVIEGRSFRATDSAEAPRVAVVNEQLVQHYWPGQDPVGKRFRLGDSRGPWVEIVGLTKTSTYLFLGERPTEFIYFPYKQRPQPRMIVITESIGDPSSLATPLREVVRTLDANQPIYDVRTMEAFYRMRVVAQFTVVSSLVAAMGAMGLGLALVGLYGLVAYGAARRTKEIGIRMAIGASRYEVLEMVLRQGMTLAVVGLGIGLLASVGAGRALGALFPGAGPGNGPTDIVALGLVAVGVFMVTLLASYVPARHASRINPNEALRNE